MPALDGVVVLDFTRLLPGPFCTQLLADLGAEVIKVEDPRLGDYMRFVPPTTGETSYAFVMVNRNKKSLAVDLKQPEGREVVRRLAKDADVVVEQFRPGVMGKLGVDYETLRGLNPRLVYCAFSGFGQDGPYRDVPGHDLNFEALSGILGVTVGVDGRPAIPGVPMADLASGYAAAFAILAALYRRERTGKGEFVDVAIFDTAVTLMVLNLAHYLGSGQNPMPGETILTGIFPWYNLYETKDGAWISIACVEPKFWIRLCDLLGCPEYAEEQFAGERRREIEDRLRGIFRARTREEWDALLLSADIPYGAVQSMEDVIRDPHVVARNMLPEVDLEGLYRMRVIGHPAKHREGGVVPSQRVPRPGAHNVELLKRVGYESEEIASLQAKGVLGP